MSEFIFGARLGGAFRPSATERRTGGCRPVPDRSNPPESWKSLKQFATVTKRVDEHVSSKQQKTPTQGVLLSDRPAASIADTIKYGRTTDAEQVRISPEIARYKLN